MIPTLLGGRSLRRQLALRRQRALLRRRVASALDIAGFPAAREEARELVAAAAGDEPLVDRWLARRVDGEPMAWITGSATFCGQPIRVDPGVYVPRPQSEALARRAAARLPPRGLAADLATGSGALAVVMQRARPGARVVGTDLDPTACRCARSNGVEVWEGDLGAPVPVQLWGHFDVVTAVVPYVPSEHLEHLPRDVRRHEPCLALDGGPGGLASLEPATHWAATLLRPGGTLLLELGARQDAALLPALTAAGFGLAGRLFDADGDLRGVEALRRPQPGSSPTRAG